MSQNVDTVYPNTIQNVAVEQEIFTFPEPRVYPRFLVEFVLPDLYFFVYVLDRCLFFCTFSFDYCVVYPSITNSDYLFYLQILLVEKTAVYVAGSVYFHNS